MIKIRCPHCFTPYFWKRLDRMKYNAGYDVPIRCRCGLKYWIVKDTDGKIISVRRDEWTLIDQMSISEKIINKYCVKHGITVEEALKHYLIREIEKQYKEKK